MDDDLSGPLPGDDRGETHAQRMDRNWVELLQELRVTQTGVQILSGFLLTLPFQDRFSTMPAPFRVVYLVALTLSVVATGFLVSPVAAHRLLFRRHEKEVLVGRADRAAKAGLTALALTVSAVGVLVFGLVLTPVAGVVAGTVAIAFFVVLWVVAPLRASRRDLAALAPPGPRQ